MAVNLLQVIQRAQSYIVRFPSTGDLMQRIFKYHCVNAALPVYIYLWGSGLCWILLWSGGDEINKTSGVSVDIIKPLRRMESKAYTYK